MVENLLAAAGPQTQACFYRTARGAEIDLLPVFPGNRLWAIDIKHSLSPTVGRGFHAAIGDLQPVRQIVVVPGREGYAMRDAIQDMPLRTLCEELATR